MAFNKIGFHMSSQGNRTGWGDHVRALDAAGIPAVCMTVGGEGIGDIVARWDAGSTVPHVGVIRYKLEGVEDVPPYGTDVNTAVAAWCDWYVPRIQQSQQLMRHHNRLHTKHGNELDQLEVDWLCDFYTALQPELCRRLGWDVDSHAIVCFSFSGGEPEPGVWERPRVLEFLRHIEQHPGRFIIGLHEYSFQMRPLEQDYPHHIGRFEALYTTCDRHNIARPRIAIHEFGWTLWHVPQPPDMASIDWAAALYALYPQVLGAGIWTLQEYQGSGIQNEVQRYIQPITDLTLNTVYPEGEPPVTECRGAPRTQYRREAWVADPAAPMSRREEIYLEAARAGVTATLSYDDSGIGDLDRREAKPWDIALEKQQEFLDWYAEYYPGVEVTFLPAAVAQVFSAWPTRYYYVTQEFCNYNPNMYPANLNYRHEGIDLRAPYDTPYYAVAPGTVVWVSDKRQSDGQPSAYGWHVIIDTGWCTLLYAHMRPNPPMAVGQQVTAGQVLGLSGNTGNSSGAHCHLTVKIPGHVDGCGSPVNYADPWEWLLPLYENPPAPPEPHVDGWLYTNNGAYLDNQPNGQAIVKSTANMRVGPGSSNALIRSVEAGEIAIPDGRVQNGYHYVTVAQTGSEPDPEPEPPPSGYTYNGPAVTFAPTIHAPADDWRWPAVKPMIDSLGIGVKFGSHGVNADHAPAYANKFRICRLFWNNPAGDSKKSPQQKWDMDWKNDFARMWGAGVRKFEIHNEAGLAGEGMGHQWLNPTELGNWLLGMANIILAAYPSAQLYYPGESPGVQASVTPTAWNIARPKMHGFCLHAYSGSSVFNTAVNEIVSQVRDMQESLNLQRPLFVSESSVNRGTAYDFKAQVYVEVEKQLRTVPGVEGIAWYISDWYSPPPDQAQHGESWYGTPLPERYGALTD